jgi:peptidoglycan/xylan/chitin deacetylase (PgdA/CDA1 family)
MRSFALPKLVMGLASKRRLLILTYHRVLAEPDPLVSGEPTGQHFREQLEILERSCTFLPLSTALERVREGTLPRGAVSITFDDGYRNNHAVALPILRELGVPATFFVATAFVTGGLMWNDQVIEAVRACKAKRLDLEDLGLGVHDLSSDEARRRTIDGLLPRIKYLAPEERKRATDAVAAHAGARLPERLMLTAQEIRELHAAGMGIGAHTVNHPILTKLPPGVSEREIAASKRDLESIVGAPVTLFAYPNGKPGDDYLPQHVACVAHAGFDAAVTTSPGSVTRSTPTFELPRVALWRTSALRTQLQLLRGYARG